jgi:hypothetical protein
MSDRYDPNHPDADWSGFVASKPSRKHNDPPPSQINVTNTGIAPTDDAKTCEWKQGRRAVAATTKVNSTFELIAGPEDVKSRNWETEAYAMMCAESKTTIDQLTEKGRSMSIRGKKVTTPAWENARPFDDSVASRLKGENPYSLNEGNDTLHKGSGAKSHAGKDKMNDYLIGYRAPHRGGDSFLTGLGKQLAADETN